MEKKNYRKIGKKNDNDVDVDVAQLERNNNKCYASAFRYIYIYIQMRERERERERDQFSCTIFKKLIYNFYIYKKLYLLSIKLSPIK